ncbi:MAG: hypothetical protein R2710_06150 [Acidimicrobiales bacterium]
MFIVADDGMSDAVAIVEATGAVVCSLVGCEEAAGESRRRRRA